MNAITHTEMLLLLLSFNPEVLCVKIRLVLNSLMFYTQKIREEINLCLKVDSII